MIDQMDGTKKEKLFKTLLAVFVLLGAFLLVETLSAIKEYSYIGRDGFSQNTITISGTGEVFAVPDTGLFSFSVIEEGKTVKDAQDRASKKLNAIIDSVKKMGIAEKDIKTTGYNSYPKYEYSNSICPAVSSGMDVRPYYCPPGKQVLTGYEVSQTISIKVRKTADSGTILTTVGSLGASNISGLDFMIDNMDGVNAEARYKAILDAKEKARILSKSLGVKLVKIVNFSESGSYPPIYYGAMEAKGMGGGSMFVAPQLPTGENKIISNVSITYEIN